MYEKVIARHYRRHKREVKYMSPKNSLSKEDFKEWAMQTGVYSLAIPALLVFLTSVQNGVDLHAALVAGCYALISALVNLLLKLNAGNTEVKTV